MKKLLLTDNRLGAVRAAFSFRFPRLISVIAEVQILRLGLASHPAHEVVPVVAFPAPPARYFHQGQIVLDGGVLRVWEIVVLNQIGRESSAEVGYSCACQAPYLKRWFGLVDESFG